MNIIFAKHDGCSKEFMFKVPDGLKPAKNNILWVETMHGETVAVATSDVISVGSIEQVAEKFGAYLPLKEVIAFANDGLQAYIANSTYRDIERTCHEKQVNVHGNFKLPF